MPYASLTALKELVLDLIFPPQCVGCGRFGPYACARCFDQLAVSREYSCVWCRNFSLAGEVCTACAPRSHFAGAWVVANYNDPLLQTMLKHLKYRGVTELVLVLKRLAEKFFTLHPIETTFDYLVPVPLHPKKFLQRGFNQAALLAQSVQQRFTSSLCIEVLARTRVTRPQYFLGAVKRRDNLEGAFWVIQPEMLRGKNILLIDDIMTSGNTANECARVLKAAGARSVWCLVWAHG